MGLVRSSNALIQDGSRTQNELVISGNSSLKKLSVKRHNNFEIQLRVH